MIRSVCRWALIVAAALNDRPVGAEPPMGAPKQAAPPALADAPAPSGRNRLAFRPLGEVAVDVRPAGTHFPTDAATPFFAAAGRPADVSALPWAIREYAWEAPAFCYRTLYFQEVRAERYGRSWGIAQPVVSAAQFYGRSLALPALMALEPPLECVYPLGYGRPGDNRTRCLPETTYLR